VWSGLITHTQVITHEVMERPVSGGFMRFCAGSLPTQLFSHRTQLARP